MDVKIGPQSTMGRKSPITKNITEGDGNKINSHTKIIWGAGGFAVGVAASLLANLIFSLF